MLIRIIVAALPVACASQSASAQPVLAGRSIGLSSKILLPPAASSLTQGVVDAFGHVSILRPTQTGT